MVFDWSKKRCLTQAECKRIYLETAPRKRTDSVTCMVKYALKLWSHVFYGFQSLFPEKTEDWTRSIIGKKGEDAAVRMLRLQGLRIVARNWRSGRYELDIVAKDEHVIVFVEVKTRKANDLRGPLAAMNVRKCQAIGHAARLWLVKHDAFDKSYRFDVVAVTYECVADKTISFQVKQYVNAFQV